MSPEFCLKLICRYLLKAGHFPRETWKCQFLPQGHNLNKLGKSPLGDAAYPGPYCFRQEESYMFSLYKPLYNM